MSLPYPYRHGRSASVFRGGRTTRSVGDGIPTEDRGNEWDAEIPEHDQLRKLIRLTG